ncbi:hypothetical protein [Micromonospora chersina]
MADKRDILIRLLGEETVSKMAGRAEKGLDKFGDTLDATEKDAKNLDKQIAEVEGSLKHLATAFARTSDEADRIDITKAIRRQQTELRKLVRSRDLLPDFEHAGEEAATGFSTRFVARLGPLMASAPGAGVAGAALGAAMAPTVGAAVAAAVVGGAGLGGVLGGALLAARDPQVKAAGAELGQYIVGDLEDRAADFVPAMLGGIDRIRAGWADLGPDLDRIFASSRFVDPLVAGMVSGGKKFVAGFADAVDQADPVVRSLARSFDAIGGSVGDVFSKLADDADEGAMAVDDLTNAITNFVDATGAIVHGAAVVKGWGNEVDIAADKGRYWVEDFISNGERFKHFGWQLDLTADGFKRGSAEADAYRKAVTGTADVADFATLKQAGMTDAQIAGADASGTYRQKLDEVNGSLHDNRGATQTAIDGVRSLQDILDDFANKTLDTRDANREFQEAVDQATDAVKRNGKSIGDGTAKGRDNEKALDAIARAAYRKRDAVLAETGSQEDANQAMRDGRQAFLRAADAMGVSASKAKALADKLFGIPTKREVEVSVRDRATAKVGAIKSAIGSINGRTVVVAVKYETHGSIQGEHIIGQGTKTRASGGPIKAGTPYLVGEEGPELITPTADGYVHDAGKTARLRAALKAGRSPAMAGGTPAGGGSVVNQYSITVNVPPTGNPSEAGRAVVEWIKAYERGSGKGWRT